MNPLLRSAAAGVALVLTGCATHAPTTPSPADAFFARLTALCGQAFAGRVVADTPAPTGEDPFAGKPLVMHVRDCSPEEIRIPFHVGDDRSRTWVVTRTAGGLRLKHDHRHQNGSTDAVTMYGGDTAAAGSAQRQEFPVDADSKAMFLREGRAVSVTNVWAMEIEPSQRFVYELARPQRLFRVEFDLTEAIAAPPAPWGASAEIHGRGSVERGLHYRARRPSGPAVTDATVDSRETRVLFSAL